MIDKKISNRGKWQSTVHEFGKDRKISDVLQNHLPSSAGAGEVTGVLIM